MQGTPLLRSTVRICLTFLRQRAHACVCKAEAFFLAAARVARRRLRRAEAAAAAAREAALAEIRAAKELSASDHELGRGLTEQLMWGLGKETKREDAVSDEEQEKEQLDGIEVRANARHPWGFWEHRCDVACLCRMENGTALENDCRCRPNQQEQENKLV